MKPVIGITSYIRKDVFRNYSQVGYEYIDTFHDNDMGWDRCFYLKDGSSIPLTKSEYENLREAIIHDIELEINKIRIKNGSC